MDIAAVAAAIETQRKELGMTKTELARKSGVSPRTVTRIIGQEADSFEDAILEKLSVVLWGPPDTLTQVADGGPTPLTRDQRIRRLEQNQGQLERRLDELIDRLRDRLDG